jgi:hypothetical protein
MMLKDDGVDITAPDSSGLTPLSMALVAGLLLPLPTRSCHSFGDARMDIVRLISDHITGPAAAKGSCACPAALDALSKARMPSLDQYCCRQVLTAVLWHWSCREGLPSPGRPTG